MQNSILGGVATLLLAGACSGPVAPTKPTWEADVFPIVQGQCLHCHGGAAAADNGYRFDFFDSGDCQEMFFPPDVRYQGPTGPGGTPLNDLNYNRSSILKVVEPQAERFEGDAETPRGKLFRPRMPPAPASPLEDWQVETIRNWVENEKDNPESGRGRRPKNRNRLPRLQITSEIPKTVGSTLEVSYVVEDADGDSVIGLLKFGNEARSIHSAGAGTVEFTVEGTRGAQLELEGKLCDGWAIVDVPGLPTFEKE